MLQAKGRRASGIEQVLSPNAGEGEPAETPLQ
jgi:hypothetical protein